MYSLDRVGVWGFQRAWLRVRLRGSFFVYHYKIAHICLNMLNFVNDFYPKMLPYGVKQDTM